MDKPHEIELLESYLRLKRKLGESEEELISKIENAFLWFAEKRIQSKINTIADKIAATKLGEIIKEGISEEIREILQTDH